jgi:predicted nucleotidyltransferase
MSYSFDMKRDEIISRIRANAEAIRALGAEGAYLYGSFARDAGGPESDVDIFIDRSPSRRFGFIDLTELEFLLRRARRRCGRFHPHRPASSAQRGH